MTNNAHITSLPLVCDKVKPTADSSSGSTLLRLTMSQHHKHRSLFQSSNAWAVTYTDDESKLFPVHIDFSEFKKNPNKNIVLLKDHTNGSTALTTCAVIMKLAWRMLPSFKCYTLHPNSDDQTPSKYQKHPAGTLYAYAEVGDTGGTLYQTSSTRTFTKHYAVKLHATKGSNPYHLELSGTNDMTRVSNIEMILYNKSKQQIASATQQGSSSSSAGSPTAYRVEIAAAGHDPVAILALFVMVHELFPMTTIS